MTAIGENIRMIRERMDRAARAAGRNPEDILLVGASKMNGADACREAIAAGIDALGENRVQEMTAKLEQGAYAGAPLHFIGHLQRNKVRQVVGRVELIHSVSSEKLLRAIAAQADRLGLVQDLLLEVNLAGEASKSGFAPTDVTDAARLAASLNGVRLRGLMCIPPAAQAPGENFPYFESLRRLAVDIRQKIVDNNIDIDLLSMGMSGDYFDAVAAGSTCVRVGSALFGPRAPMAFTHD